MNRILTSVAMVLLCGTLTFATPDRGRNSHLQNSNRSAQSQQPQATRPGSAARPGSSSNSSSRPGNNTRPGNATRPGGNANWNQRPGGNYQRPGHNAVQENFRPGNNWNHNNNRPGPGAPLPPTPPPPPGGPGAGPGPFQGPRPIRPHMPPYYGWYRPTPPPQWSPVYSWRPFQTILGVALGSTINFTINALINNGYAVTSYGNNDVFVSNVPMLNMIWPDAVLFYNNAGGLCGSRFVYSTPYYDQGRYNAAYASLLGGYGSPVSIQNTSGGGVEATWWGTGNQFIRLSYDAAYAQDGTLRYYTTLSFGN